MVSEGGKSRCRKKSANKPITAKHERLPFVDTKKSAGVLQRVILYVLITVSGLLSSCSSPHSPYEQARARNHQQLSAIPEFQEIRGQRSKQEAEALSWQLSRQEMHRLSDKQLLRRVSLRSEMLAPVPNGPAPLSCGIRQRQLS